MNRRIAKEFRALLLPWAIAAGGACILALNVLFEASSWESMGGSFPGPSLFSFFFRFGPIAFFGGIVIFAALGLGTEFQQRTLSLLLSQPIARRRVWNEKMLTIAFAMVLVCSIGLVAFSVFRALMPHAVSAQRGYLSFINQDMLIAGTFLLATICSAGFWTLFAGSTIGG